MTLSLPTDLNVFEHGIEVAGDGPESSDATQTMLSTESFRSLRENCCRSGPISTRYSIERRRDFRHGTSYEAHPDGAPRVDVITWSNRQSGVVPVLARQTAEERPSVDVG